MSHTQFVMIFKDVSRIKVDRPRNSYHSPIPSLQLMSKVSTFDGDLKEEFREEQVRVRINPTIIMSNHQIHYA